MTPTERKKARDEENRLEGTKEAAEEKMAHYDRLSPEERRRLSGW